MTKTRILIVEDEPPIRSLIVGLLSKEETYTIEQAKDGREALDFLEERGFDWDVILTDMQMPRMTGYELIQQVSAKETDISIIVLTAFKNDSQVIGCLERGVYDYVLKPVSVRELLNVVRRVAERRCRLHGKKVDIEVTSGLHGWVELTAPSNFEFVERFRTFSTLLGEIPLEKKIKDDLRIAIDELGQNAVEWGNQNVEERRIRLSYCIFNDRIVFKVEDEGEGFNPETLSDPSLDPLAHIMNRISSGKRIGGYGVFITKQLMDDIMYSEKGNVVILTKYFGEYARPSQPAEKK